jgi:uncharacterized iron-regulated membrane protein
MSLRIGRRVYQLHKWIGLLSGLFLVVIGITGSIIVFTDEIDRALNRHLLHVTPLSTRISYDSMLAKVREQYPDASIRGFRLLPEDDYTSYTVPIDHQGYYKFIHINPYTGEILGERVRNHSFAYFMLVMHYSLWWKPWGELIVGILGITLFLSGITGIYIYRNALLKVFSVGVRWKKGSRILFADIHKLVGVSTVIFNLILSISGFYMMLYAFSPSYLLSREKKDDQPVPVFIQSVDTLMKRSKEIIPGFVVRGINLPSEAGQPVRVYGYVPGSNFLFNHGYGSYIQFDSKDGSLIKMSNLNTATWSEQLEQMLYALHFGQYGGLPIKILYFLGGLTPAILSITGLLLWRRRRIKSSIEVKAESSATIILSQS